MLGLPTYAPDGETVLFANEVQVWEATLDYALIEPSAEAALRIRGSLETHEGQFPSSELREGLRARLGTESRAAMRFKEVEPDGWAEAPPAEA